MRKKFLNLLNVDNQTSKTLGTSWLIFDHLTSSKNYPKIRTLTYLLTYTLDGIVATSKKKTQKSCTGLCGAAV